MENLKNATKSLYAKRPLFFQIGLVTALTLCFIAFEFKVYIEDENQLDLPVETPTVFISDDAVRTKQPPKLKPPKVKPKNKIIPNIVEAEPEAEAKNQPDNNLIDQELEEMFEGNGLPDEKVDSYKPLYPGQLEVKPQFKSGMDAFYEYVANAIEYPKQEKRMNIGGRVIMSFIIETDGSLSNIEVLKGVSTAIDEEATRVLKESPNWEPGRQRGRPVRVKMTIPIYFELR